MILVIWILAMMFDYFFYNRILKIIINLFLKYKLYNNSLISYIKYDFILFTGWNNYYLLLIIFILLNKKKYFLIFFKLYALIFKNNIN